MIRHEHDTYTTPEGRTIRLINNAVLVKMDKAPEATKSGILYPDGSMEGVNITGTVLAYGYVVPYEKERVWITGLEVGDKVAFIRFLAEQHTNKQVQEILGEGVIKIAPSDIILIGTAEEMSGVLF